MKNQRSGHFPVSVYQELRYSFEAANLAVRFGSTCGAGAVKHRSQPARAPKNRYRKTKAATRMASRSRIEANFSGAAGDVGARSEAARHMPSARTARGANKAATIAPWTKRARIIP